MCSFSFYVITLFGQSFILVPSCHFATVHSSSFPSCYILKLHTCFLSGCNLDNLNFLPVWDSFLSASAHCELNDHFSLDLSCCLLCQFGPSLLLQWQEETCALMQNCIQHCYDDEILITMFKLAVGDD